MKAALAQRLLWKEYRTHRGLWGALVVITVLLQLLSLTVVDSTESFAGLAMGIAMILTVTYAAGSGAMSFAVEREEGTQVRLQAMSCPPALTVSLKLGFALVTTLVMILAFGLSARLVGGAEFFRAFPDQFDRHQLAALLYVVAIYAAVLLWSMFFSLLTRKVLSAVVLGAVAGLCFVVGSVVVVEEFRRVNHLNVQSAADFVTLISVAAAPLIVVLIGNFLLAGRWCRVHSHVGPRKNPFRIPWLKLGRGSSGHSIVLEIGTESADPGRVLSAQEATGLPAPSSFLAWLLLSSGSRSWKEFQFLRWRETAESRGQYFFLLAACMIIVVLFQGHELPHTGQQPLYGHLFVLFVFPAVCGLLSFRQEQSGEQFRILRDRGIRPLAVWWSKNAVWGLRMVTGLAVLIGLAGLGAQESAEVQWMLSIKYSFRQPRDVTLLSPAELMARVTIISAVFYSVGMASSLFFRKTIVSFCLGLLLSILVAALAIISAVFEATIAWTLLPLIPGLLLATLARCRNWMLEDDSFFGLLRPILIVAGTVLICVLGLPLHEIADAMSR